MKKSYLKPALNIVILQHHTQLLQGTTTQGKFTNGTPSGWDAGGASSRRGGWDDYEE